MSVLDIIKQDYQNFPQDQTYDLYAKDVYFQDPLNSFTGLKRYQKMIGFIDRFFQDINLELHSIAQEEDLITTEWTLKMRSPLPWKPLLSIRGWSELKLNSDSLIIAHCDRWKTSPWQVLLQNFAFNR